jgi:hypothetical protein
VNNWRYDTRLIHKIKYPDLPAKLAFMVSLYCHEGPWKLLADRKHQVKQEGTDA